ncbi:MAG: hypothetical protein ACI3T9_02400 [Romboutsia timonensis]
MISQSILDILSESGRKNWFTFQLLDKNENVKVEELNCIESFSMTYSCFSDIRSTASFNIHEDSRICYTGDMIKVTMHTYVHNTYLEMPLGIFILEKSNGDKNGNTTSLITDTATISGYSKLNLYKYDKFQDDYEVSSGTNIYNEILRLLNSQNVKIPTSQKTLSNTKVFEMNTTKLEAINYLLDALGYTSLGIDGDGYFTAKEYVIPQDKEITFEFTDETNQIMLESFQDSIDTSEVFNIFTGYNSELGIKYTYINDRADSEISTVNWFNRCDEPEEFSEVTNEIELQAKVKAKAARSSQKYYTVTFQTLLIPILDDLEAILFKNKKLNIKAEWVGCSINSNDSYMQHTIRRVMYL